MKNYLLSRMLFLGMFFVLINSCTSTHYISIDVLQPAKVSIPPSIQNVVLINHCYARNYSSVIDFQGNMNLKFDSIFSIGHVLALDEYLANSPRLKVLKIYNAPVSAKKSFDLRLADSICNITGADGAIILDKVSITKTSIFDTTKMDARAKVDSLNSKNNAYNENPNKSTIVSKSEWKLYDFKLRKVIDFQIINNRTNLISDSWELQPDSRNMPSFWDILYNSANQSGYEYGKRIAQQWASEQRYIYTIPEYDFELASNLVDKQKWNEAITLWEKYLLSKNKRVASIAAFNIAVCYEANDQLSEALNWASKSFLLNEKEATTNYINQLELRLKNKYHIMRQMNGGKELVFENNK
jgi:hypothetical protein